QAHDIARKVQQAVLIDRLRRVALAVPSLVRRHRMVSRGGQRGELMPPRIPALRKTVTQDHERSFALLRDVQSYAVRLDHSMAHCLHVPAPSIDRIMALSYLCANLASIPA